MTATVVAAFARSLPMEKSGLAILRRASPVVSGAERTTLTTVSASEKGGPRTPLSGYLATSRLALAPERPPSSLAVTGRL